jgi:cystathionine beta-lyase family protein involved in aluminum resistance
MFSLSHMPLSICTGQTLPIAAEVIAAAAAKLQPTFAAIDKRTQINLKRVLDAYRRNQVSQIATLKM